MKVLFVGPSLYDEVIDGRLASYPEIECRGPASQGDIVKAVLDGATIIGLIDGRYEDVASPWHKEILYALSQQVHVLGAGSLGALRAAECAAFGMVGVGRIFERYLNGELVDDSDVAQLHGPAELGYLPLTEAMVNIQATFEHLVLTKTLRPDDLTELMTIARSIFFKDLTFENILEKSALLTRAKDGLMVAIETGRVDLKRHDAWQLVRKMSDMAIADRLPLPNWRLSEPSIWRRYLHSLNEVKGIKS